jgi:7-carboxy-7-deazaguanine synthase
MNEKKYAYSEIFNSLQGEGKYSGFPTAWLRYYTCNLECNGFGQKDPTDPTTYQLPFQSITLDGIKNLEELPVFKYGCDSSYSWSAKFKHLQHKNTPEELALLIQNLLKNEHNPQGLFRHPKTLLEQHLCFTGGEPLLKAAQSCTIGILRKLRLMSNMPMYITFETNGTQLPTTEFMEYFSNKGAFPGEVFFSVSPKLFNTSGEKPTKAIKPDVVAEYVKVSTKGQLKFVVNGRKETWDELESVVKQFRDARIQYPVYIMAVGATEEAQNGTLEGYVSGADIATECIKRGYIFTGRLHTTLWGNQIGT